MSASSSSTSSSPLLPSSALTLIPSSLPHPTTSNFSPTSLSPALIALTLSYIYPPSQLSSLPPHLISSSLLQRHHFLHLSPDDPVSYLSWPSDSNSHMSAVRLLEAFQKPIDDISYSTFPICYSTDAESAYAHVAISPDHTPGLRLVFQWNSPEGWKYHNITLMPFPLETFDAAPNLLPFQPITTTMNAMNDQDDSYWNAYCADDPDDPTLSTSTESGDSLGNTEDAYWAQYAEVHGSGDSAQPSPLPTKRGRDSPGRVYIAYTDSNPSSVYNPLEPPSPNTLSRRLESLSPRSPSPSLIDDNSDSTSASTSLFTPSAGQLTQPKSVSSDPSLLSEYGIDSPVTSQSAGRITQSTELCDALKDTIRGVYCLWRAGRARCPRLEDKEEEQFLNVVRQALTETSRL